MCPQTQEHSNGMSDPCERVQIPHPPEEGFFLGSAFKLIRKDHHRAFSNWGRQLGPIYAVRVLCWHVCVPPFTPVQYSPVIEFVFPHPMYARMPAWATQQCMTFPQP